MLSAWDRTNDRINGGFKAGELFVICGSANCGKTLFNHLENQMQPDYQYTFLDLINMFISTQCGGNLKPLTAQDLETVKVHLKHGRKVDAIKHLRESTQDVVITHIHMNDVEFNVFENYLITIGATTLKREERMPLTVARDIVLTIHLNMDL